MCEPSTIAIVASVASVAIAAAGTGVSLYAQSEQADAEANWQKRLAEARNQEIAENFKLAVASAENQNKALQQRAVEEGEAATEEKMRNAREAAKAVATARVAAGEGGVSGTSVNALLNDFLSQEARYRHSVTTNLEYARDSIDFEQESNEIVAKGRAASIKPFAPSPIQQPNYLAGALKIAGSGLDAYAGYRKSSPNSGA
jgi:hypothetical protein